MGFRFGGNPGGARLVFGNQSPTDPGGTRGDYPVPLYPPGTLEAAFKELHPGGGAGLAPDGGCHDRDLPICGCRGGLFHACAAFQPLFWAVVPVGLFEFISWGGRKRGWQVQQASQVFGIAGILLMVGLSMVVTYQKVIGPDPDQALWGKTASHYREVEGRLQGLGAAPEDVVMVKNPPGYTVETERQAIVIPDGDHETMMAAASRYGAGYIILEADHARGLDDVYQKTKGSWPGITYLGEINGTMLFEVR